MPSPDGRNESPTERADRNLNELMGELRVALPGVQVLFAFLLAVPFQPNFDEVTPFQERVYFATLLLSALASALLIAPTTYHRINFRRRDKPHIVEVANGLTVAGMTALALAMTGAILLVTDYLFTTETAIVTVTIVALCFTIAWFVLPLRRRMTTAGDDR